MVEQTERRIAFVGKVSRDSKSLLAAAQFERRDLRQLDPIDPSQQLIRLYLANIDDRVNFPNDTKGSKRPLYWIIDDNPDALIRAAKNILEDALHDPNTQSFAENGLKTFLGSLTIIKMGAETHLDRRDEITGIRTVHLVKGEIAFPTHPTPNS